jgi:hypothetical protein
MIRPVKRHGSRNPQFVQRIPADVRSRAMGLRLDIPIGDTTVPLAISAKAKFVRLSLRTSDHAGSPTPHGGRSVAPRPPA